MKLLGFLAAIAIVGCSAHGTDRSIDSTSGGPTTGDPSSSGGSSGTPPSMQSTPDPVLTAVVPQQYGGKIAATSFSGIAATQAGNHVVITGQAVTDAPPGGIYTLPTVIDLILKVPAAMGGASCDREGTTAMEADVSFDSNGSTKQKHFTTDPGESCTLTITSVSATRIAGSFEGLGFSDGTFDVPIGAAK